MQNFNFDNTQKLIFGGLGCAIALSDMTFGYRSTSAIVLLAISAAVVLQGWSGWKKGQRHEDPPRKPDD